LVEPNTCHTYPQVRPSDVRLRHRVFTSERAVDGPTVTPSPVTGGCREWPAVCPEPGLLRVWVRAFPGRVRRSSVIFVRVASGREEVLA